MKGTYIWGRGDRESRVTGQKGHVKKIKCLLKVGPYDVLVHDILKVDILMVYR